LCHFYTFQFYYINIIPLFALFVNRFENDFQIWVGLFLAYFVKFLKLLEKTEKK